VTGSLEQDVVGGLSGSNLLSDEIAQDRTAITIIVRGEVKPYRVLGEGTMVPI
jgi:hypothetical protein